MKINRPTMILETIYFADKFGEIQEATYLGPSKTIAFLHVETPDGESRVIHESQLTAKPKRKRGAIRNNGDFN
jgi:hypothetical protein